MKCYICGMKALKENLRMNLLCDINKNEPNNEKIVYICDYCDAIIF